MPITDASTSLATTWTEQSTVTWNAGTLTDISSCQTEVESKLRRGTLTSTTIPSSTEVQRWLIRAKEELAEVKGFSFKRRYAYIDTVATQYRYSLPPDYNGGWTRLRDLTSNIIVEAWEANIYDIKFPDPSDETNDNPSVFCIKNNELWLSPPPDGVYRLELEYDRSGVDNTASDFTWLPEQERFRCCDFAVAEAFESLQDYQRSDRFRSKWSVDLAKSIRADGKRKWRATRYQALSWQQAYSNKFHQGS